MGLDMALTAEMTLYGSIGEKSKDRIEAIGLQFPEITKGKVKKVIFDIAEWRKANQIHKWFVENVQEGKDECEKVWVEKEQIQSLLDVVNEVLDDNSKAGELLPVQAGFFFGGTEYDEWYFDDLKYTKEVLEAALGSPELLDGDGFGWDFYYWSSW